MSHKGGLLVLVGTKAQFIKTAPILCELDARGIDYQLVYTGQHSETFELLEAAFATRPADDVMVPKFEAATHGSFLRWSVAFFGAAAKRIRLGCWKGSSWGIVHGDTASTLFSAVVLRLAGIKVAHVEAGLRSSRLLEPFPEEIVRRLVSRLAAMHFAPDSHAVRNLDSVRGEVVDTGGNTLRDALVLALRSIGNPGAHGGQGGYAVVSLHRSENLGQRSSFDLLMEEITRAADVLPVKFVLHPATREKIKGSRWEKMLLAQPNLELVERMAYPEFVRLLLGARCLMTDGGSNEEEAALLGLPTLLLRRATERPDGLDGTVVLSGLQRTCIREFLAKHAHSTWPLQTVSADRSPSARIVEALVGNAQQ